MIVNWGLVVYSSNSSFEKENERDFRISSNQIQPHIMFMNEGEHEDINTDSENDICVFGQESDWDY